MEDRVSASKKDLLCLEMLEDSGGDDSDYEGFDEDHGEDFDDYGLHAVVILSNPFH